jgi:hypothetical protein
MERLIKILGNTLEQMVGKEISTYDLLTLVYEEKITDRNLIYLARDFDDFTIWRIHIRLLQEAKERGIKLAYTKEFKDHIDMLHAIPYAIKQGRKSNARFDNKIPEIKEIELSCGGWISPYGPVIIRFEDETVYYALLPRGNDKNFFKSEFDNLKREIEYEPTLFENTMNFKFKLMSKTKSEFLDEFKSINVGLWAKEYSSIEQIMDGCQWELKITYNDGKARKYSGDNDYPRSFDDLCRLLEHPCAFENDEEE